MDNIVVIPALAERERLFQTLASIAANPKEELCRTVVLCVINNSGSNHTPPEEIEDNQRTLTILYDLVQGRLPREDGPDEATPGLFEKILESNLNVAYIDASSSGFELPEKTGGVGLARKIGLDSALRLFDHGTRSMKLLFSLDADTLVESNYLSAVRNYFEKRNATAAVIEFMHQGAENPEEQAAMYCYEIFLRYYVFGLCSAGSPYAFHTIGSTIVCTAEGYVAVRGMNRRKAGEDFYFLNKLAKIQDMGIIPDTHVYPSARQSERTPFGTGKRIIRFLEGNHCEYRVYNPGVFVILRQWLDFIEAHLRADEEEIMKGAGALHPSLTDFLDEQHFTHVWPRLKQNSRSDAVLRRHFCSWFDGFKTLKLIHHLTHNGMPPVEMFGAVKELLSMVGTRLEVENIRDMIPPLHVQKEILDHLKQAGQHQRMPSKWEVLCGR